MTGCFYLAFLVSFILWHVTALHSFCYVLFTKVPLQLCTTLCLSFHQLMGIWVVPALDYFEWCCYEQLYTSFCMNVCFYFSWVVPRNIAGLCGVSVLKLTFWAIATFSPNWLYHFLVLLAMFKGSNFFPSSLAFDTVFYLNHHSWDEVKTHCGFYFFND